MKILIAGGTGFIGKALVKHLLAQNHSIIVLGRKNKKINSLFGNSVKALTWDELDKEDINAIKDLDFIINLCGANIGEARWTEKRRLEIINSRVVPTKKLAALCAKLGSASPALFNASAVGVYGWQATADLGLPEPLDENEAINYDKADDFLSYTGHVWEKATFTARDAGVRVVLMRFGVVLGKEGGALSQMAKPFRLYLGGPIGDGKQPLSWVSLDDLMGVIDFLMQHPEINGPINIVAPECVTQKQFAAALGTALNKPSFLPTPAVALTLLFGQMAEELLLRGQHVVPFLLQKHHFKFRYPTIQSALNAIYRT